MFFLLEFIMSFESRSLLGTSEDVTDGSEDTVKSLIEVQAEIHVYANNYAISDSSSINPNDTEIDPIVVKENPLSKQMSNERLQSQSSVTSDSSVSFSVVKEKYGEFVVQMTDSKDSVRKTPPLPRRYISQRSRINKRPSLLRKLSRDSSFSPQEGWRKRNSTTRLKSKKNYISFHNIVYTVPQGWFFQHKPPKVILNNVRSVAK